MGTEPGAEVTIQCKKAVRSELQEFLLEELTANKLIENVLSVGDNQVRAIGSMWDFKQALKAFIKKHKLANSQIVIRRVEIRV